MLQRVLIAPWSPAPCIRHTSAPRAAGDWHWNPLRFDFAWHLDACCISKSMGLFFGFFARPSPRGRGTDVADDGLAASMYVDVFHHNFLLTLAAVSVEGFEQCRISAGTLVCLVVRFSRRPSKDCSPIMARR